VKSFSLGKCTGKLSPNEAIPTYPYFVIIPKIAFIVANLFKLPILREFFFLLRL
jgi:hypothetical protein